MNNASDKMTDSFIFYRLSGRRLGRAMTGFKTARGIILTACSFALEGEENDIDLYIFALHQRNCHFTVPSQRRMDM